MRMVDGLSGTALSTVVTRYQIDVLEQSCHANMAMTTLERFRLALNVKWPAAIDLGCANDLPRTVGTALRSAQEKKIKWMMSYL